MMSALVDACVVIIAQGAGCTARLGAALAGRVELVDQLDVGAVALLKCACILLASARLEQSAALAVIAGLKGVAVRLQEQCFANYAHSFLLVSGFKNQYTLSGRAVGADLGLASQHSLGHVVGAVGTAEGGNGHGSRFVVEALASCPHILQALLPVSRGACRIS